MPATGLKPRNTQFVNEHSTIWPSIWLTTWVFIYKLSGSGFESSCSHLNFRFCACLSKEFLDIQATIECGFTLKHIRDMTRTCSQENASSRNIFVEQILANFLRSLYLDFFSRKIFDSSLRATNTGLLSRRFTFFFYPLNFMEKYNF